jgi:hypothetical protein
MKAVLAATALLLALPATASATTATVTGDDGNPVGLSPAAPISIRNMDVQADIVVGASETPYYTTQTFGPDGIAASSLSLGAQPVRQLGCGQGRGEEDSASRTGS